MDNIYFVEPNSNSVISHEHPVRTPGIVVVVRSNWESETGCSRIQNEKISAGQFACGVLMFVVGILQITSMPDNSDDFKFYLPLLGGNILYAVGIAAFTISRRKQSKCKFGFLLCLNVSCVLLMTAVGVSSPLNIIACKRLLCQLSSAIAIVLGLIGATLSAFKSHNLWIKLRTEEIYEEVNNDSDSVISNELSVTTTIITHDNLRSSTSVPETRIAERWRGLSIPPELISSLEEAPPPYEEVFRRT